MPYSIGFRGRLQELLDHQANQWIDDAVKSFISRNRAFDHAPLFEHGQMLGDDRLRLFQALVKVRDTDAFMFDQAEDLESDRVTANLKFLRPIFQSLRGTRG
jgi:hypothetical protein